MLKARPHQHLNQSGQRLNMLRHYITFFPALWLCLYWKWPYVCIAVISQVMGSSWVIRHLWDQIPASAWPRKPSKQKPLWVHNVQMHFLWILSHPSPYNANQWWASSPVSGRSGRTVRSHNCVLTCFVVCWRRAHHTLSWWTRRTRPWRRLKRWAGCGNSGLFCIARVGECEKAPAYFPSRAVLPKATCLCVVFNFSQWLSGCTYRSSQLWLREGETPDFTRGRNTPMTRPSQ